MYIRNQVFFVLGVSKSGFSACEYILKKGGKCYFYEEIKNEKLLNSIEKLSMLGGIEVKQELVDETLNLIDVLIVSPGVPINHEIAVKAKSLGKRIIGELEFGYLCLTPTIVGVTGTNGKTTTVSLISNILKGASNDSLLVGNIGVPVTSQIENIDKDSICVAEVSSFQLETISSFCPHVSCILNITPDHLERHYTMENYIYLKKRITQNQKESEYCVLNYDDETVRELGKQIKAKIVWISTKTKVEGGYVSDNKLFFNDEFIIDKDSLPLIGEHNVYNSLFSIACCKILAIDNQAIVNGLKEFKGVPHRVELVLEKNGVKYYNDSKSTNTSSTITAINCMKTPTILIVGGSEKGETYDKLFLEIKDKNIYHTIITGASRYKMLEVAEKIGLKKVTVTHDFGFAINIAKMMAFSGSSVLLSPACASFDFFTSYIERGEEFCKIVREG